jgi:hypothetical protein
VVAAPGEGPGRLGARRRSIPRGDRDRWVGAAKGGRGLIGGVVLVLERAWNGC